jgi:hypothetical protein
MMAQEVAAWQTLGMERSLMSVVLEHGEPYEIDRDASAQAEKGYLRDCFQNAALAALWDDNLQYAEGFAHRGGVLAHHAWAVTPEGKAVEVTWRDGGTECGFCTDGIREVEEGSEGWDESDEETWTETCPACGGSGESSYEHQTLEHAQYFGIVVDKDALRRIIHRNGLWGALHAETDLDEVLAAKKT